MNYNFISFPKQKSRYKGGLTIAKRIAFLSEQNFPKYERINILLDYENKAIKIVEGTNLKLSLTRRGLRGKYHSFSCVSLVKSGFPMGHFIYKGHNIFVKN